ncbi:F-box protein At5g49610-like [Lolium perenne]|uniref:F-box protein At5g49610-like n=1 Tax=Lolium perenne TaxID=4522 RepID=UPI0021F5AA07|nr:F-box protein At5g07610-like [Lolium perenne]
MPPGGGGCRHGSAAQDHPPAAVLRDEGDPLLVLARLASQEKKQKQHEYEYEQEQDQPAVSIPEGPLAEILARVPYRSLCRFKCVSKPWLALCSSRDICKRSPQTLSGFFYYDSDALLSFCNLNGRGPPLVDPSLPFLRERYKLIFVKGFCAGLLLCTCWESCSMGGESHYVVCNPATKEWTVLPPIVIPAEEVSHRLHPIPYLGFDAAIPTCFAVFAPLRKGQSDSGTVAIYSSQTGQWTYVQSKWSARTHIDHVRKRHTLLDGTMHLTTRQKSIVTVDMEGKVWREIKMPDRLPSNIDIVSIGKSQGRLYAWQIDNRHDRQLYIWVLEDYGTGKWILKHTVNVLELFRRPGSVSGFAVYPDCNVGVLNDKEKIGKPCRNGYDTYDMFAVHPDCNVIFLTDKKKMTISYNLDNHKVEIICTESIHGLPYIPCFAELPVNWSLRVSAASSTQNGTPPL